MEKEKKLMLMRYWLFGIFVIIFAAVTIYIGGALGFGLLIFGVSSYWLFLFLSAALCVATYFIYKLYLDNKA